MSGDGLIHVIVVESKGWRRPFTRRLRGAAGRRHDVSFVRSARSCSSRPTSTSVNLRARTIAAISAAATLVGTPQFSRDLSAS